MSDYILGVVGAGNMAEAILRGAIESGFIGEHEVVAYDPVPKRQQVLSMELGVLCAADNTIPGACPRILLAVKPQVMSDALDQIAPAVGADTTVISIAAGITTKFMDQRLGGKGRIVRVMPNTPMFVGAGVSAVAAGPRATAQDIQWAQNLLAASGKAVVVEKEEMLNAVTAVSGSGPAYFFYLIEAMTAAGVSEGLDPDVAELLSVETCIGAGQLLRHTERRPADLRRQVTTPGGTTEAAFHTLEAAGVKLAMTEAVQAAAIRCRELGK